jgi:hypothetical protein
MKQKHARKSNLTPEQKLVRAECARVNGAKSQGSISAAGRQRSSLNGLQSGLRAESYPVPDEVEADARSRESGGAGFNRRNIHKNIV